MATVSPDRFAKAVRNTMETLRNLADGVIATGQNGRKPADQSKAAKQLKQQDGYSKRCDWENPIGDALSTSGFALSAACDHAKGLAALFTDKHNAIYSQIVVARALLEACVITWWLDDPAIGTHIRVRRCLSEQLHSANQLKLLDMPDDDWAKREAFWQGVATQLKLTVSEGQGHRQMVNGECRPNVDATIVKVLDSVDPKAGHQLYCLTSAVAHSTWYGLRQGLVETKDLGGGLLSAALGSQSVSVESQAWISMVALRRTAERRFKLMGWEDGNWLAVANRTQRYELRLAAKIVRQRGLVGRRP